ncbi:CRACD-like protein isoform X2 [Hoplias malabaricus]
MASGSIDVAAAHEPTDAAEESSGKKKSKFQTFKNFFAKKKRKEAAAPVGESVLKCSQSSDDLNTPESSPMPTEKHTDSGSKMNLGGKALSHDSVFTSDSPSPENNDALRDSQDSIHGKVKSLQMQLKQAIRVGSPMGSPAVGVSVIKSEDSAALSEDDGLPCSPPEFSTLHTILNTSSQRSSGVVQRSSSLSLEGTDSDDDQLSNCTSSRPGMPQLVSVDFSLPPNSLSCLDNSAAHHRIAVKTNACIKRKPASKEMLQNKRRDLRERVLLRDTEDKLKTVRTCAEVEESQADVCEAVEEVDEESQKIPAEEKEEDLQNSSQRASTTSAASAETSEEEEEEEEEERFSDRDHFPSSQLPESSWDTTMTLELQGDDFLLDARCEVVSEEQGSLLEEVLSSLKSPLTSALALESEDETRGHEVESVLENEAPEDSADLPEPTDQDLTMEEDIKPVINTLSVSDPHLEDTEGPPEPLKEDPAEEASPEEEQQVPEAEVEKEEWEDEDERDEGMEEMDETLEDVVEEVGVEQKEMEENRDEGEETEHVKNTVENVEDAETEEELVEEFTDEDAGEVDVDEAKAAEEDESKDETCPLEMEEECDVKMNSEAEVEVEKVHEFGDLDENKEVVSVKTVVQPQETTERPCFVVTTSLDLSVPNRASNIPKQEEEEEKDEDDEQQIQPKEVREEEGVTFKGLREDSGSSQLADDHLEVQETLNKQDQPNASETRPRFTVAPAWQRSLSGGSAKEGAQDFNVSSTEEEPAFKASPDSNQQSDAVKPEQPSSPVRAQSVPSTPVQREMFQAHEEPTPENPFGVRLRKTAMLHIYTSEGDVPGIISSTEPEPAETHKTVEPEHVARKPALPKKPDQILDGAVKPMRTSDVVVGKSTAECSESPSWISVARQKQKLFSSLEESPEIQEEFNKKGSLPDLSSPVTKDQLKPVASPVKVSCSLEIAKPGLVEKESKRSLSHSAAPLAQDEPPWLALAKKKAKAWSEMPQIVQ